MSPGRRRRLVRSVLLLVLVLVAGGVWLRDRREAAPPPAPVPAAARPAARDAAGAATRAERPPEQRTWRLRVTTHPPGALLSIRPAGGPARRARTPFRGTVAGGELELAVAKTGYNRLVQRLPSTATARRTCGWTPPACSTTSWASCAAGPTPSRWPSRPTAASCGSRCWAGTASRCSTPGPCAGARRSGSASTAPSRCCSPATGAPSTPARWRPPRSGRSTATASGSAASSPPRGTGARSWPSRPTSAPCTWPTGCRATSPRSTCARGGSGGC